MRKRKVFTNLAVSGEGKDTLIATTFENCYCVDGVLKAGVGVVPLHDENGREIRIEDRVNSVDEIFLLYQTIGGKQLEYLAVLDDKGSMYTYDPNAFDLLVESGGAR